MDEVLTCNSCGWDRFEVRKKEAVNGVTHVGAYCVQCNRWLRWLPSEVAELTPIGDIAMPFGKHKGKKLKDLPKDYLEWMATQSNDAKWSSKALAVLNTK